MVTSSLASVSLAAPHPGGMLLPGPPNVYARFDALIQQARNTPLTEGKSVGIQSAIAALLTAGATPAPLNPAPPPPALTVDGNTISTGRYKITADAAKSGSVTITDTLTNTSMESYGDPHVRTSDGDMAKYNRQGMVVDLQDGTQVRFTPTEADSNGVAFMARVDVLRGGEAAQVMFDKDQKPSVSKAAFASVPAQAKDATVLVASQAEVSDLFFTRADGTLGDELISLNAELDLDGRGGASMARFLAPGTAPASPGGAPMLPPNWLGMAALTRNTGLA